MSALRKAVPVAPFVLALLLVGAGGATTSATVPSLYVNYTAACHFTLALDGGGAVTAGSSIPYGSYQLVVNTPFAFASGQSGCENVNFSFTGPGVSYSTTLNSGEASQDISPIMLQANATYTATDSTVPPTTTVAFGTSSTQVTAPSSPTGSGKGSTSSGSASGGTSPKTLGTLVGTVSPAGKLSLTLKGKKVTTLTAGDYAVTVSDKSSAAGFVFASGHTKNTATTAAFKGTKKLTIDLSFGQWYFYGKAGATKTYFITTKPAGTGLYG
ncbi:MAG TPA: hypothetical protein VH063_06970 [Gaiellaceae bacterium]|nr:hypothetical protein [Gaiellaceae bacterium]